MALNKLRGSTSEVDIFDALDGICNHKNYLEGFLYSAPYMSDTCDEIIAGWET